jgi:2-phosphoglycerate kinase
VTADDARRKLRHVFWIAGASGSGKSTIARRLAEERGLHLYSTDDVMAEHARRVSPRDSPHLARFSAMDLDERWLHRPPETMLETFHWFQGEGFGLIVEDLLALPAEPGVVAEGFRLLPSLVQPVLADPTHAVWLLPTPEFRRAAFEQRGSLWAIAGRTSDPERALRNLLERDAMFTDRLRNQTRRLGLRTIEIDLTTSEDALFDRIAGGFGL